MYRVFLTGNASKEGVRLIFDDLREWLRDRCDLVAADLDADYLRLANSGAELGIVIGGDGTLIGAARGLGDNQVPLIGVNAGKLGFLAEFSASELKSRFCDIRFGPMPSGDISRRIMLEINILRGSDIWFSSVAVNDCVVRDPFRMIRLSVLLDGTHLTNVPGDGIIVSTPTGSTAYNLAAGGPILLPDMPGIVLTPICPHGLTFRPLVVEAKRSVTIRPSFGSGVIVDGQRPVEFQTGDEIVVRRFHQDFMLIHNPVGLRGGTVRPAEHRSWHSLRSKLGWGQ